MNEVNKIQVETPLGLTDIANTNEGLGQGGLDSAFLSSTNLDNGTREEFKDSTNEVSIGKVMVGPILFFDDCMRIASSVNDAQAGIIKLEQLAESKLLNYNMKKTKFVVIGEKKAKEKLEEDVDSSPLMLYNTPLKKSSAEKYVGWYLSDKGLANCAQTTIERRVGNVKKQVQC